MYKLSALPWWSSIGLHKPQPAHEDDLANMGTAFGLDACMNPGADAPSAGPDADAETRHLQFATDRLNGRSVI